MESGKIVLASLPQNDGQLKLRPALVLQIIPPFNDLLVCGISTQIKQEVFNFDNVLQSTDADFKQSGLAQTSLIRLGYLAVIPRNVVAGGIGKISVQRLQLIKKTLSDFILK